MKEYRRFYISLTMAIMMIALSQEAWSQRFSVASFRVLSNDVTAFVNPVRDLNDEDCGLVKVMGSPDFVFSSPLGIVKREDKVGEIWLYLPRGSKKITIKHPEWGVMRDYVFPQKIDSHLSYELRLNEPTLVAEIESIEPVVTTIRDTLLVTRVDTLVILPEKQHIPLTVDAAATLGFGGKSKVFTGGVMVMALKRHGGFVHIASDFNKIGATTGICDRDGEIDGFQRFYTGRTRHSTFMINAGAAHRVTAKMAIFEGIGYSSTCLSWELASSEGGGWVKNSYYTTKGISAEAGMIFAVGRIALLASVVTVKGTEWFGSVGIGIKLG